MVIRCRKYEIKFEVKNQLDEFNYLLTISNSEWCYVDDLITVYGVKLYNINDSGVNLLTNTDIDSSWEFSLEQELAMAKQTILYDYRFDPDVVKMANITSTSSQIKLESTEAFTLPAGNYVVEGYLDANGAATTFDVNVYMDNSWWCEASTLNNAGSYDISLGTENVSPNGLHSRSFSVNEAGSSLPIQIWAVGYPDIGDVMTAYGIKVYRADDESKTNLLPDADKAIENWTAKGGAKQAPAYDGRFGQNTVGDLNGDNAVDILDLVKMKKRLVGMQSNNLFIYNADIDGDKRIIAIDLVALKKILLFK